MKRHDLLQEVGYIGEDLIREGADDAAFRRACRPRMPRYMRGALAACLALVILAVPLLHLMPLLLPERGGNATPPSSNVGGNTQDNYHSQDGSNDMDEDACTSLMLTELLVTELPLTASCGEGITLQFSLPGNRPAWDEYSFCIAAADMQISESLIKIADVAADQKGNRSFSLVLKPEQGATEGTIVCILMAENAMIEPIAWQRTYHYKVVGDNIHITK